MKLKGKSVFSFHIIFVFFFIFNFRSVGMGDPRPQVGGWAGVLQDLQVPADVLPHLLQLHDPGPGSGETQGGHQAALSLHLPLQVGGGGWGNLLRLLLTFGKY